MVDVDVDVRLLSGESLLHLRLPAYSTVADVRVTLATKEVRGSWLASLLLEDRAVSDDELLPARITTNGPLVLQFVQRPAFPPPCSRAADHEGENELEDCTQALVVDTGTSDVKFGFAGDDRPRALVPTLVGRPKVCIPQMYVDEDYVGDTAWSHREMLHLSCPIHEGIVVNWVDAEKIWHHTFFNELRGVAPENHPILMTEPPLNPKRNRETLTQMIFETFNAPAFYLATCSALALYSSGRTTGVVFDSGLQNSRVVPVYEGYVLSCGIINFDVGGNALTEHLLNMLRNRGFDLKTAFDMDLVKSWKEKHCYVALDFNSELKAFTDGCIDDIIETPRKGETCRTLGAERIMCPEVLFKPSLLSSEASGIHTLITACISRCEADLRTLLYDNIVLAGGSSCFPGFAERLKLELDTCVPGKNIRVTSHSACQYSAWIGGSMLADSLRAWITKERYDAVGPDVVHRMCP